jgi:excisionase family DNA binding protein
MNTKSQYLMDETEAAKRLAVSVRTVQAWRLNGRGPKFVRLGSAVRYSETALAEFIERGTVASTSEVA